MFEKFKNAAEGEGLVVDEDQKPEFRKEMLLRPSNHKEGN